MGGEFFDIFFIGGETESVGSVRFKDFFRCFDEEIVVNSLPMLLQTSAIKTNGFSFSDED